MYNRCKVENKRISSTYNQIIKRDHYIFRRGKMCWNPFTGSKHWWFFNSTIRCCDMVNRTECTCITDPSALAANHVVVRGIYVPRYIFLLFSFRLCSCFAFSSQLFSSCTSFSCFKIFSFLYHCLYLILVISFLCS